MAASSLELMKTYRCPSCSQPIPLDDINVAADIALCRACGESARFSALAVDADVAPLNALLNAPQSLGPMEQLIPPEQMQLEHDSATGTTTITYRPKRWVLIFLVPFTLAWGGGSMWGIYLNPLMEGRSIGIEALFGLPFFVGTIALLGVCLFFAVGRVVVTLRPTGGSIFNGIPGLGYESAFALQANTSVELAQAGYSQNGMPQYLVQTQTLGQVERFGRLLEAEGVKFTMAAIRRHTRLLSAASEGSASR